MDTRAGNRGVKKSSISGSTAGSNRGHSSSSSIAPRSPAKSSGVGFAGSVAGMSTADMAAAGFKGIPPPSTVGRDNPAADTRSMRRIIADDPNWTLATVPDLVELTLRHIVNNFATHSSILNKLQPKNRAAVLKRISTDLPLKITARLVDDDDYWKRCCQARWSVCDVSQYGGRWKRMFFERNLQAIIELFVPETTKTNELDDAIALSANYVRRLTIRQLLPPIRDKALHGPPGAESEIPDDDEPPSLDHFDFNTVLPKLPFLEEFSVTYGVGNCGMNFEWSLFQFTVRDCRLLSQCVNACRTLRSFSLQRSKVDDDKVRMLVAQIMDHPVLAVLDLSHNAIGDRGARALGKMLTQGRCRLERLALADNAIRAAGAQALAHALTRNSTLQSLDLRLNRLADDGGQAICRALLKNTSIVDLGLAANELTEPTASLMAQVVSSNNVLLTIDLSCNRLGQDGGRQLQEGMEQNETVTEMDLRLTECGQESEFCINQVLMKNRERRRAKTESGFNRSSIVANGS